MANPTREITKSKVSPRETGTPVLVRLQAGPLQQLDDWRRQESDLPSRADAIRRLMAIGIAEAVLNDGKTARRKPKA